MGADLPSIDEESFFQKISAVSPRQLSLAALSTLWIHYQELRRWNPRLSLVGPGTAEDPWSRHYGESLAALELLEDPLAEPTGGSAESPPHGQDSQGPVPQGPAPQRPVPHGPAPQRPVPHGPAPQRPVPHGPAPQHLVDVGSGGGFPGFVLAAALGCPVTLVEARQRKWAFLQSVSRKAGLPCRCLNARVSRPLPPGLPGQFSVLTLRALRLPPAVLEDLVSRLDSGGRLLLWQTEPFDKPPAGFVQGRVLHLEGSEHRSIVEYVAAQKSNQ